MKKQIFIFALLACCFAANAQDLIVTTAGDSLKCKIVEVRSDVIQFRFGDGNIIDLKRSDIATFRYNFVPSNNENNKSQTTPIPIYQPIEPEIDNNQPLPKKDYGRFYLSFELGGSSYGTMSLIEEISGTSIIVGLDAGYFFTSWFGAGLRFTSRNCDVVMSDDWGSYNDFVFFYGPAVYGRFGNGKFSGLFTISVGQIQWSMSNMTGTLVNYFYNTKSDKATAFGTSYSVGGEYMFTKKFGISACVTELIGNFTTDSGFKRDPTGIGFELGFNFRF